MNNPQTMSIVAFFFGVAAFLGLSSIIYESPIHALGTGVAVMFGVWFLALDGERP